MARNDDKKFRTDSGIERLEFIDKLGPASTLKHSPRPGQYPFLRGIHSRMYRERLWTMRQYAGYGTARSSNERYKYLLANGQTGLSVAFDLPTQIGYDSDDSRAIGEVGKTGVAIDTLADMETLFEGVSLDKVSTSMTINSTAAILLAMYIVVAQKQGINPDKLRGTVQNDILKEYIARGTYIFPPQPSLKLVSDIFVFCKDNIPQWNMISISGYHIREAGATAAQEVAFTLANAICYVENALNAGLKIDDFAPKLSFFFNAHNDLFEEVAKFRAARYMWAKIVREKFGAKDNRSCMLRFHTQTAGSMLTSQQPENNIARVTIQALAAVLGGTQSLHTNSFDEALALPSEKAARIALRTQQIIAYESGVPNSVDPLGGSFYVEYLTDALIEKMNQYLETIEKMGGALQAVSTGYYRQEIERSAYEYQKSIERKDKIVVGVNEFITDDEPPGEILRLDETVQKDQLENLRAVKSARDDSMVAQTLKNLKTAVESGDNLMPPIIECVKVYCSIGEICGVLREIWGEYES